VLLVRVLPILRQGNQQTMLLLGENQPFRVYHHAVLSAEFSVAFFVASASAAFAYIFV
jgi:hypothetical protein